MAQAQPHVIISSFLEPTLDTPFMWLVSLTDVSRCSPTFLADRTREGRATALSEREERYRKDDLPR